MELKFKRMHDNAVLPVKGREGDAAFDLVATEEVVDLENRNLTYKLGWAVEIPTGYVGLLAARSSVTNKDIILGNSVGIIDENYRGELMVKFKSTIPRGARKYDVGERVAQLMVVPVLNLQPIEVPELSESNRGEGSFGSSGT